MLWQLPCLAVCLIFICTSWLTSVGTTIFIKSILSKLCLDSGNYFHLLIFSGQLGPCLWRLCIEYLVEQYCKILWHTDRVTFAHLCALVGSGNSFNLYHIFWNIHCVWCLLVLAIVAAHCGHYYDDTYCVITAVMVCEMNSNLIHILTRRVRLYQLRTLLGQWQYLY